MSDDSDLYVLDSEDQPNLLELYYAENKDMIEAHISGEVHSIIEKFFESQNNTNHDDKVLSSTLNTDEPHNNVNQISSEIPSRNESISIILESTNDVKGNEQPESNIDLSETSSQTSVDSNEPLSNFDALTCNNKDIAPEPMELSECEDQNIVHEESEILNEDQNEAFAEKIDINLKNIIFLPKKTVNGISHYARNKRLNFSSNYDEPADLYISLITKNMDANKMTTLKFCSKEKHIKNNKNNYWFFCNERGVKFGESFKIPLLGDRRGRDFNLRFPCNSSCTAMFKDSKLQFTIVDSNNVICFEEFVNIKISERPARDERKLVEKIGKENLREPVRLSYEKYQDIINDPDMTRKEYPKLINHTIKNCKFEINLTNENKVYEGIKFSQEVNKDVYFRITELSVPFTIHGEKLFVRCMIFDPKFPDNPIICEKHRNLSEARGSHILRSSCDEVEYVGNPNGIYPDERLSILIPAEVYKKISLHFMCNNSCYVGKDRKYAGLNFILESQSGKMLARRFFKFTIVSRPKRSELNFESDDEAEEERYLKRKQSAKLNPAKKRKS